MLPDGLKEMAAASSISMETLLRAIKLSAPMDTGWLRPDGTIIEEEPEPSRDLRARLK